MLSYLHAYHAGNVADVQKHAALMLATTLMQAKSSPIAFFDTHAGSALYDLTGERALKTGEAAEGIQKVWVRRQALTNPDWVAMLDTLAALNGESGTLIRYPGSPAWIQGRMRPDDRLTAFELHPAEQHSLSDWAKGRPNVRVRHEDGLKGLLASLPPSQPRLLVLMDPSYEIKSDYADVAQTLEQAWRKCRHGVYLVWYPILTSGLEQGLKDAVAGSALRKVWCSEIHRTQPPARGMTGSGLLVVNPPWGLDQRLNALLDDVSGDDGLAVRVQSRWLIPE